MHSTVMGGAHFILHAAGWLEGGLVASYEKLVLDADRLGAYQVLLGGLATDENAMARSAYGEVAPAGHFLGCSHTMANYETAFYDAVLSNSESFEQWKDDGEKDAMARAHVRWTSLLDRYEAPPIDAATDEALKDYVARREADGGRLVLIRRGARSRTWVNSVVSALSFRCTVICSDVPSISTRRRTAGRRRAAGSGALFGARRLHVTHLRAEGGVEVVGPEGAGMQRPGHEFPERIEVGELRFGGS